MNHRPLALSLCLLGCGARTGLRVDPPPPTDAGPDVPVFVDPVCRPLRVRLQLGQTAALRLEVDQVTRRDDGYAWSLRRAPTRSRVTVSGSTDTVTFTPDVIGAYDLNVTTPYPQRDGSPLQCPVQVQADPVDPLCPEYDLEEPQVVALAGARARFAFENHWSAPRVNEGGTTGRSLVSVDAPGDDVAALVAEVTSPERDLAVLAGSFEAQCAGALGAVPVLVGRTGRTAGGWPLRRSTFRLDAQTTTAAVARDRIAHDVIGLNPGVAPTGFTPATRFVFEVTTVLPPEGRALLLVAVAPEGRYDNLADGAGVRLQDFTNATGLGLADQTLDVACQRATATRNLTADFLWLVDTSRSMEDDQERLGNTAEQFFRQMNNAGIDFRVGVIQAGSAPAGPDLDSPGFAWVSGAAADGASQLAWQVTYQRYHDDNADALRPYPLLGGEEEPLAAGVVTTEAMDRRATDPDDARRFRPNATRVAFFVTDEAGTNDDSRYFALDRTRWGAIREDRVRAVTRWWGEHAFLTFAMANVFVRAPCPSLDNFVTCVALGNGGAYIPISTATDAEVSAGFSRIVDAVAGAASEFSIDRGPVSATLRVRLDDTLVPRSRADGFDYDPAARTLSFRGTRYRPRRGQVVRSAFFTWR